MATASQITANQHNAQRSTGPITPEGKAAVSQNAFNHGLTAPFSVLPHEDQDEFDALLESYRDEFQPTGYHQNFMVNQMAQSRWKLARVQRLEACFLEQMLDPAAPPTTPDGRIVANMLKRSNDPLAAFQRYTAAAERSYYKAHHEFQAALKDARAKETAEIEALIETLCGPPRMSYPILPPSLAAESHSSATRSGASPNGEVRNRT